jgi:hypothetical protein
VSGLPQRKRPAAHVGREVSCASDERSLTLRMDRFAWETIEQESARLGVPVEQLVAFAAMYYLADVDSGRVARRIDASPYADADASS